MNDVTATVSGLDELEKRLIEEGPKVARKAVRNAGKKGGEVIRQAIEANATQHEETGFMAGHIVMVSRSSGKNGSMTVTIGPQADAGYFRGATRHGNKVEFKGEAHLAEDEARFLEFGTKHQAATPFVGPGFESSSEEALSTFVDELWNNLRDLEEK